MSYKRRKRTEEQWASTPPDVIRCTGHLKSDGTQCRWEAVPGTNVCTTHGGAAPQVQARAAVRIQMSVDDGVKRLLRMLDDPQVEPRDKIKIVHDFLDRGGLGATSKHLIGVVAQDPVEQLFRQILGDPEALADPAQLPPPPDPEIEALNARAEGRDWDDTLALESAFEDRLDVVDAEVVEEVAPARPARQPKASKKSKTPPHIREALEKLL